MSIPMDPLRSPQPPVAQALAEAALQRQSLLLGGKPEATAPLRAAEPVPAAPASGAPQATPLAPPPLPPVLADRVSLSPQARQRLGEDSAAARGAQFVPATLGGRAGSGLFAEPASAPGAAEAAASAQAPPPAWPTTGVAAPLRSLVDALVQQLTASVLPQQVLRVQPWPAALVRAFEESALPDHGDGLGLPVLQTWLVRQGVVQTPEGARGVALTLRVPAAWVQAQAPALAAGASVAAPLRLVFAGPMQGLQSGVVALVLQGMGPEAVRTSALLVIDFQPQQAAQVYGRDMAMRPDPWVQMAALQASGQVPRDEDKARRGDQGLCHTPGCPYAGLAECEQPFCLALRRVIAVAPARALGAEAPDPSAAEPGGAGATGS